MRTPYFRPLQPLLPVEPDIQGGGRRRGNTEIYQQAEIKKQKAAREAAIVAVAALEAKYAAKEEAERRKRLKKYQQERQAKKMGVCKWCKVPYGILIEDHKPYCHKRPIGAGHGNVPGSTAASEPGLPESTGSGSGDETSD